MKTKIFVFILFFTTQILSAFSETGIPEEAKTRHGVGLKYDPIGIPTLSVDYLFRINTFKSTRVDLSIDALSFFVHKLGFNDFGYLNLNADFFYFKDLGKFSLFAGPKLTLINQFYNIDNHKSFDAEGNEIKELPKAKPYQFSALAYVSGGVEYSFTRKFIARGEFNLPFVYLSGGKLHFTRPAVYNILPAISLNYFF